MVYNGSRRGTRQPVSFQPPPRPARLVRSDGDEAPAGPGLPGSRAVGWLLRPVADGAEAQRQQGEFREASARDGRAGGRGAAGRAGGGLLVGAARGRAAPGRVSATPSRSLGRRLRRYGAGGPPLVAGRLVSQV